MQKAKQILLKAEDKMSSMKTAVTTAMVTGAVGGTMLVPGVHADAIGGDETKAKGLVTTVADAIAGVLPYIGVFFILMGGFKVVQGVRNDNNPEAISSGAKDVVIGAVLIAFKALLWNPIKSQIGL
jgi:hypothetical protein